MQSPVQLSKADARRALVRHHFAPCSTQREAFERLRSVQFDPIAPVGCNHDLVLQARVKGYKIGDWQKTAYDARLVYDGWDKQASLIPFEGWSMRRIIYSIHRKEFEEKIFRDHREAVDLVLKEITERGALMPRDFEFQQRREEWKGSWFGPSVTKQTLRALWHSGLIMTATRKGGQHVYDLTERVVPAELLLLPMLSQEDAIRELALERHRAMGILRPAASYEIWANRPLAMGKRAAITELVGRGEVVPVEVEGMQAHAPRAFLALLDQPALPPRVRFIGPLDQFMWDRKMIAHLFGFDYIWEIYTPEVKRRWGYYVLPILFGDELVARVEFYCRRGVLELRAWHFEDGRCGGKFFGELEKSLREFMKYCSATSVQVVSGIDERVAELAARIG
ncbi:MAG: winged helix DNA-binding domain-containing protein [Armatimonadetes bacterium]|nr:winged helix DNA-binding domain-containing protein [Armatimonadota bacterium]